MALDVIGYQSLDHINSFNNHGSSDYSTHNMDTLRVMMVVMGTMMVMMVMRTTMIMMMAIDQKDFSACPALPH